MEITCWGARGSLPVSGEEYIKYGGNTTCFEIRAADNNVIVLDAGSGIQKLGNKLIEEEISSMHMIFTHAHWDHIMGFPFFKPIYRKNTRIKICGCTCAQAQISNLVSRTMEKPFFPINYDQLTSNIEFEGECRVEFDIGSVHISTIILNHPQNGLGYKFTENGKSFVFLTDNELSYAHPKGLGFDDYARFSEGVELLIHDAEYKESEYAATRSWGHSLYTDALRLAVEADVKRFGLFHHNVDRKDADLDLIVEDCRQALAAKKKPMDCFAVSQGMTFKV